MKIFLGSSSPRRYKLLQLLCNDFDILIPDIDETPKNNEKADEFCYRVTTEKGNSLLNSINKPNFLLITSDTLVAYRNHILGKPIDFKHAVSMLEILSGKKHNVISGISLQGNINNQPFQLTRLEKTTVYFKKLSKDKISNYLNMIHYMDKAGSYAIQEHGDLLVENISGSISNIVGFPMGLFYKMLLKLGLFKQITGL